MSGATRGGNSLKLLNAFMIGNLNELRLEIIIFPFSFVRVLKRRGKSFMGSKYLNFLNIFLIMTLDK